jgi:hypothetical protein
MKIALFAAALGLSFLSFSSAHADEVTQCRVNVDTKSGSLVYSNRALTSEIGEALPETCLTYFLQASQKEILPVVLGKSLPVILDIRIPQDDQMNIIDIILSTSPRTKTKVEIRSYLGADDEGMNDIKATLSAKPNYEPAQK